MSDSQLISISSQSITVPQPRQPILSSGSCSIACQGNGSPHPLQRGIATSSDMIMPEERFSSIFVSNEVDADSRRWKRWQNFRRRRQDENNRETEQWQDAALHVAARARFTSEHLPTALNPTNRLHLRRVVTSMAVLRFNYISFSLFPIMEREASRDCHANSYVYTEVLAQIFTIVSINILDVVCNSILGALDTCLNISSPPAQRPRRVGKKSLDIGVVCQAIACLNLGYKEGRVRIFVRRTRQFVRDALPVFLKLLRCSDCLARCLDSLSDCYHKRLTMMLSGIFDLPLHVDYSGHCYSNGRPTAESGNPFPKAMLFCGGAKGCSTEHYATDDEDKNGGRDDPPIFVPLRSPPYDHVSSSILLISQSEITPEVWSEMGVSSASFKKPEIVILTFISSHSSASLGSSTSFSALVTKHSMRHRSAL